VDYHSVSKTISTIDDFNKKYDIKNMKIGIIGAIKQEIKTLKKIICPYKTIIGKYNIYIGTFKNNNIFLITSGIGKVSASIACMILINLYKIDVIMNTGSAGSLLLSLKIGDVVIPEKVSYYDVDLINFGYTRGQIPKYPKEFLIHEKIKIFLETITKQYQLKFKTGLMISGDSFIHGSLSIKKLKNQFPTAIAVEMESAAIAQVCYQFNIPFIIIKSISDLSDKNATLNFEQNIDFASFQSSNIVKKILENITNI